MTYKNHRSAKTATEGPSWNRSKGKLRLWERWGTGGGAGVGGGWGGESLNLILISWNGLTSLSWATTRYFVFSDIHPTKTQISLRICAIWSMYLLSIWINKASREDWPDCANGQADRSIAGYTYLKIHNSLVFLLVLDEVHTDVREKDKIQSNPVISNSLISNYRLSRNENLVPVLTWNYDNR